MFSAHYYDDHHCHRHRNHDHDHLGHLMDHRSSCRSAEIAPNQSELRWAIAELVAMHEDGDEDQVDDNDDGDDYQVMILLIT